jgi:cob(I)alamin adenosyltransferase
MRDYMPIQIARANSEFDIRCENCFVACGRANFVLGFSTNQTDFCQLNYRETDPKPGTVTIFRRISLSEAEQTTGLYPKSTSTLETPVSAQPGAESVPPPRDAEAMRRAVRRASKKKGLVIVHTGKGKGKTTAALGMLLRAWGRGMKVGIIQFIKNENARFGEIVAAERMGGIDWVSSGDGFTWTSKDMDETEALARNGWKIAQTYIASGKYNLLILDEFTYPLHFGWLDTGAVIGWLRENKPDMLHLVITGRNAPSALIDFADLVTEMVEVKHPFKEQGVRAQPGIEF